jgi:hypothetical protein
MKLPRALFLIMVLQLTLLISMPVASAATLQVVPSEPFGVSGSNLNGIAYISWQEPNQTGPGITHYLLYRQLNGTGSALEVQLNASDRWYNDRMPVSSSNVTYWIVAANIVGTGNASDKITLVPNAFPTVPTGLHATAGVDYVDISWTSPSTDGGDNLTGFEVRRQEVATGVSVLFHVPASITDVPNTSFHDDQVSSGTSYFYNVMAVTNSSESGWSDSLSVTSLAKDINDNSGLISVFALVLAVVAIQIAFVAIYVVIKRKAFKPKAP